MSDSPNSPVENESRLSRWSRLKHGRELEKSAHSKTDENDLVVRNNGALNESAETRISGATPTDSLHSARSPDADSPLAAELTLPSIDEVALDRDFTPFMQPKIPEALKRQALKALFKDAHFNTMDGLDTYIDDYTKFEPISAEEMAGLSAWKSIMKPLEQVVTPGGYAVDVESEEGKAVLAARAELARGELTQADAGTSTLVPAEGGELSNSSLAAPEKLPDRAGEGAIHPRYGKRVGDFKSTDTAPVGIDQREVLGEGNLRVDEDANDDETASLPRADARRLPAGALAANDDPR